MNLPRKISPDPIRDAIVEIRYQSGLPPELLVGLLFGVLDDTYTYANTRPDRDGATPALEQGDFPDEINLNFFQPRSLFYNDAVVVQMLPGSITFTCRERYVGWDAFRPQIEAVMRAFEALGYIQLYTRVGIRYINDFAGIDLAQNTRFTFEFGLSDVQSHAYRFRAEFFKDNDYRVNLQLGKRALETRQEPEGTANVSSVMDVDVIRENLQIHHFDDLLPVMDAVHKAEKEVFYSVLKEEFLETLHPEY